MNPMILALACYLIPMITVTAVHDWKAYKARH